MTKLKLTLVAVLILLGIGAVTIVMINRAPVYTPPPNPNPQAILYEAQADTTAGRYREALAKHIWYRDNALRYDSSQTGVRNSFALMYWAQLGEKYPPAMKRLKAIRDEATKQVKKPNTGETFSAFITVVSINNGLKEPGKNVELFKWLDSHNFDMAKRLYSIEENDLIEAGRLRTIYGGRRFLWPDIEHV